MIEKLITNTLRFLDLNECIYCNNNVENCNYRLVIRNTYCNDFKYYDKFDRYHTIFRIDVHLISIINNGISI